MFRILVSSQLNGPDTLKTVFIVDAKSGLALDASGGYLVQVGVSPLDASKQSQQFILSFVAFNVVAP